MNAPSTLSSAPTGTPSIPRIAYSTSRPIRATGSLRARRQRTDPRREERDERNARMVALLAEAQETPEPARRRIIQRVIVEYLEVADAVANRYRPGPQDHADVQQVAYLGLVKAVQRFDPARGGDIVAFAVPTITGEIKRYFRDASWMVRPPRSLQELGAEVRAAASRLGQLLGREPAVAEIVAEMRVPAEQVVEALACTHARRPVSLDEPMRAIPDAEGVSLGESLHAAWDGFSRSERLLTISHACRGLSARDRKILWMRFVQDCTQEEIARECQVTQMQISRVLARILRQLRERLSPDLLAA